ncbi:unnamed protein product [Musa acuminata subsp. burmannicoides]
MLRAFGIIQWDHYQIENVECDDKFYRESPMAKRRRFLISLFCTSEIMGNYGPLN